jgi:hypothetical protein
MDSISPATDSLWRTFVRFVGFCFLAVALLYMAATVVVVMVLRHSLWHQHLLRFIYRVWLLFVAEQIGSTSPGFVNSLTAAIVGIVLTAIGIVFLQGWAAMRKHLIDTAAMGVIGLATVLLLVYGTQFAWEVAKAGYADHQELAARANAPKPPCPACPTCPTCSHGGKAQEQRPPVQELPNISWTQEQTELIDGKPTVTVLFRVDATLELPAFLAICDRPCKPIYAEAGQMSHRRELTWPGHPDLAGTFFDLPKPMPGGTSCKLRIESADSGPVKITMFRILKQIEVPVDLK